MFTLADIEAKLKEFNPAAVAADVTALELRLAQMEVALTQLAPTIQALLTFITPLLPLGTQVPSEVMTLLAALPKPAK